MHWEHGTELRVYIGDIGSRIQHRLQKCVPSTFPKREKIMALAIGGMTKGSLLSFVFISVASLEDTERKTN